MHKLQLWGTTLFLLTAIALAPFFVGCEDEPSTGNVDSFFSQNDTENQDRDDGLVPLIISPELASTSYVGERIALRAKGAVLPVTWSPANYDAATVTVVGPRSDYAVFQTKALLPNAVLAVDAAGRTATADITVGSIDSLTITPSEALVINTNMTVEFVVSGGSAPYTWESVFPILGTMTDNSYAPVHGANYLTGTNLVTVTDALGDIATATVIHQ